MIFRGGVDSDVIGKDEAIAVLGELRFYALRCDIVEGVAGDAPLWEAFKRGERAF